MRSYRALLIPDQNTTFFNAQGTQIDTKVLADLNITQEERVYFAVLSALSICLVWTEFIEGDFSEIEYNRVSDTGCDA